MRSKKEDPPTVQEVPLYDYIKQINKKTDEDIEYQNECVELRQ